MMDTTTTDGGAADAAQPDTSAAVTTEHNADQVITKDDNGTPTLVPDTSTTDQPSADAVSDAATGGETQAEDVTEWAKKKGLPLDDPVKLAGMYRDAEKKMHEATQQANVLANEAAQQATLDYTGDENYDVLAQQVNGLLIQNKVNSFWQTNPEAREYEGEMVKIVQDRPHLQNDIDALYALAKSNPNRETELRQAGGREALQNLAQKQQAVPPSANATNSAAYESSAITPQNVASMVDNHDQKWFETHYDAINKAMSGK